MKKALGLVLFILICVPCFTYAQNMHREETRITDFATYRRTDYRLDNYLYAMHIRILAERGNFSEDRLTVFSQTRNGIFYTISIGTNGQPNSVSVGGDVRQCSENAALCADAMRLARVWYEKLGIDRVTFNDTSPPSPELSDYLPPVP
jgi:hypothetical protein